MMGAGKTTVGKLLADRLARPYLDSDAEVEASTDRTVREIFETEGEPAFRAEEGRVLAEALARSQPAVISVAGGAVLDEKNRALIRAGGTVVWLRAEMKTLAARVRADDHRPLLGDDPESALARLYSVRRPIYEDLAEVVVDVDDVAADDVADEIMANL